MSNPPFTRDPKAPPFHLRTLTPNEFATWRRLIEKQEASARAYAELLRTRRQP